MLFLSSPGDVFIQPTQDERNPVMYGVFSTSGYIFPLDQHIMSNYSYLCLFIFFFSCFHFTLEIIYCFWMSYFTHLSCICLLALCLKAQLCVSTQWLTSEMSLMALSPINTDTTTNGLHTQGRFPILVREQWVSVNFSLKLYEHFDISPTVFVIA